MEQGCLNSEQVSEVLVLSLKDPNYPQKIAKVFDRSVPQQQDPLPKPPILETPDTLKHLTPKPQARKKSYSWHIHAASHCVDAR